MNKQVITISPDGNMSSLHHKKHGLDLGYFGNIEVERVSEIKWNSSFQQWYVEIINGPAKGTILSKREWRNPTGNGIQFDDEIITFGKYEDAVEAEVLYLNKLRKKGVF